MNSTFIQTVQLGLKSLRLQKMRAGLAALGIFIGTTTVIWLVAMGEGVSYRAQQQIKELGATNIIIRAKQPTAVSNGQDPSNRIKTYGLLRADYRRIVENIPSIRRAVPMRELAFECVWETGLSTQNWWAALRSTSNSIISKLRVGGGSLRVTVARRSSYSPMTRPSIFFPSRIRSGRRSGWEASSMS
jgi:hypothetical protein